LYCFIMCRIKIKFSYSYDNISFNNINPDQFSYSEQHVLFNWSSVTVISLRLGFWRICCLYLHPNPDISKYAGPSDLTGKNQAGPTMFSAYWSENPVKICSLHWSGNNFLFVGPSNNVFKSRSFLHAIACLFLWIT
jgi:hypothetical protein